MKMLPKRTALNIKHSFDNARGNAARDETIAASSGYRRRTKFQVFKS